MSSKKKTYLLGAVAGAGVMAAAVAGAGLRLPEAYADQQPRIIKASTAGMFAPPPGAPMSFADIFDRVSPAVVSINVTSRVDPKAIQGLPPGFRLPFGLTPPSGQDDEEDQDQTAPPQGGRTPRGQPRLPSQQSSGSGFFISADGYIVTNNHVVENAETIKVVLKDEREFEATVVGRDEGTDLAVIKVKGSNFPFVNFENAARPRVGDWVIAVGNPFGLGGTATAGIISAYGRDIGETFVDYIQIDAPINRGNSGGPTFDIYGRVIGVNTAIFSPSGGSVGIGFAIPAEVADATTKQLIAGGKVERGYIGATVQNFTTEMAEAQGMGDRKGAIVSDLVPGGPSERAGLMPGDVVTQINGVSIKSSSELTREVAKVRPGGALRLNVIRDGKPRTIEIRSGTRPSEKELAANDNGLGGQTPGQGKTPPGAAAAPVIGLTLAPLDEASRRQFSIGADVRGALITSVDTNSDAGQKGLRRGDVIVRAGDRPVANAADLSAAVAAAKSASRASVLVGISRANRTLFLPLKIAD